MADDDDLAADLPDEPGEPAPPSLRDFGPDIELLASIYDRLGYLIAIQATAASGKKQQAPAPARRPVTAAQRARALAAERRRQDIESQLWPDREAG